MTSDKIKTMIKSLELAASGEVTIPRKFLSAMAVSMQGIREEVMALEGAQVPRRQRLTVEHMNSNVHLFPVAARREANLP